MSSCFPLFSSCSDDMHKSIFALSLLAVATNAQQQPLEPLTKYRASLFRRALQSFCSFARADPQEDQRWPACLFDAASPFALALEEDCALQPTSTILKHSRSSLPDTWLPAAAQACMQDCTSAPNPDGVNAFCIGEPCEDWHQISRSQEQNGVSWKNRLPVQVVRAGATAPPRRKGNSSF